MDDKFDQATCATVRCPKRRPKSQGSSCSNVAAVASLLFLEFGQTSKQTFIFQRKDCSSPKVNLHPASCINIQNSYYCSDSSTELSAIKNYITLKDAVMASAREQHEAIWNKLIAAHSSSIPNSNQQGDWPSYNEVLQDVRKTDYHEILTCPADIHPLSQGRDKTICPQGAVCCAKLELFPFPDEIKGKPYSGLLQPGSTAEHCILRLSSALQPIPASGPNKKMAKVLLGNRLANAKLFPAVAMKLFRGNRIESGNMLFLGCKVGQEEEDFFAHCLSSQITSSMPVTLKPILKLFQKYSATPLLLGNSNLCSFDADGEMSRDFNFPFCLTLRPTYGGAKFSEELLEIPAGTHLYDLFASPDPLSVADGRKLQRIGRVVTTSQMIPSTPQDGLFFRHQKKDEDFQFKPHWKAELQTKVTLKTGRKGTVASVAGWKLFEHQIADGGYIDFEQAETTS